MKKLKLVPYALAFSLATFSLTSCGSFNYKNVEGEVVVTGNIDYDELSEYYKIIELKTLSGESKLYIVKRQILSGRAGVRKIQYNDIFTGEEIYDSYNTNQRLELIHEYELVDFLVTYDEVRGSYTIEDIERLYNKILGDYEFGKSKTLEK